MFQFLYLIVTKNMIKILKINTSVESSVVSIGRGHAGGHGGGGHIGGHGGGGHTGGHGGGG